MKCITAYIHTDDVGISNNLIVLKFCLLLGFSFIDILMAMNSGIKLSIKAGVANTCDGTYTTQHLDFSIN